MKCPSCSQEQHSCHVDGNMKLYQVIRRVCPISSTFLKFLFPCISVVIIGHIHGIILNYPIDNYMVFLFFIIFYIFFLLKSKETFVLQGHFYC